MTANIENYSWCADNMSIPLQVQAVKQSDFSFQVGEGAIYFVLLVCIFIMVAYSLFFFFVGYTKQN